jgi:hypothetical protein
MPIIVPPSRQRGNGRCWALVVRTAGFVQLVGIVAVMKPPEVSAVDDPAVRALGELSTQIRRSIAQLEAAEERLAHLAELRAAGRSWFDIVSNEDRPLVVETITRVLEDLGETGSRFRREEALALQRENISTYRIGELFGVTRQRISALLRDRGRPQPDPDEPAASPTGV